MNPHLNPLHCIIPPHMLKNMIENGSPAQKEVALASITASAQFRGKRQALAESVPYLPATPNPGKQRRVFNAENGSTLPGTLVRNEGEPPVSDTGVNEAYDGAGATYDLYWEVYQRNSVDGLGLRLDSSVHYQKNYDKAWL